MSDYISRQAAIDIASGYCHLANIAEELGRLPPADAVEVVRCKDCKYAKMGECEHKLGLIVANDENFCSYGERKDG